MARIIKATAYFIDYNDDIIDSQRALNYWQGDINHVDNESEVKFFLEDETQEFNEEECPLLNECRTPEDFEKIIATFQ